MTISAVNTLEIRINAEADSHLEQDLNACIARIQRMQGCLGYSLTRSPSQEGLWILSGYWSSAADMTAHFTSEPMSEIVSSLIDSRANLMFTRFTPAVVEA